MTAPRLRWLNLSVGLVLAAGFAAGCVYLFQELSSPEKWRRTWDHRELLWKGWTTTLIVSAGALVGSTVVGLALLFGQRSPLPVLRWSCRAFLELVRDTPLLVQLLVGYFVIFAPLLSRPLTEMQLDDKMVIGVLLLSLFEGAYLGEILRGGVESIPQAQWDSARAVGFDRLQVYRHVIFPQALRRVLPAIAGLFVSLIKDSSLLSVIGVTEFTHQTRGFITRTYIGLEGYVPLALGYLVLTLPVAWLSHRLEKRFRHET